MSKLDDNTKSDEPVCVPEEIDECDGCDDGINGACVESEFLKMSNVREAENLNVITKDKDGCFKSKSHKKRRFLVGYITKIAILSSLSVVLYMFARFPIFTVFPFSVLDMDFASIPSLLGGFALGPIAAVLIELIKCTIKLTTTNTMFVGELSSFIVSTAFVLPSTIIYKYSKYKKTKKGAIIGLIAGVFTNVIVGSISNYFIILPLYSKAFNLPVLMTEYREVFAFGYGVAFNLIKSVSVSIITFLLYKRVSKPLHL